MRVFVTGVAGQLGYDVMKELARRGHTGTGSDLAATSEFEDYRPLDITDGAAVERVLSDVRPDAVIHCAAWTAVDDAEEEDKREPVAKINVDGTQNVANACKRLGCKMLYVSTDYVFDGQGTTPWTPDCKSYQPLNFYGLTKLGGERCVAQTLERYFIVRIAWAFGQNGKNFIRTMLSLADRGYREIKVVDDQIGTPTYTYDLARLLVDMIETEKYGYYHATNEGGYLSWADFAEEIFRQAKREVKVTRVTTKEYGLSKAKRPFNSRLDRSKLAKEGFKPLPDWRDALRRYLQSIGEET